MAKNKKVNKKYGLSILIAGIFFMVLRMVFGTIELTAKASLVFAWIGTVVMTVGILWLVYDLFVNWSLGEPRI